MRSKKLLLLYPIILIVILVWIAAVYSVKNNAAVKALSEQTSLVEKADKFIEDEIYSRAIPLYNTAYKIKTENSFDISYKLEQAYKNSGDTRHYISTLSNRCEDKGNNALESEFIALAEYYFTNKKYDQAMKIIDRGLEIYDSTELFILKSDHKYDFYDASGLFDDIRFVAAQYLPVCINGKWGYINNNGGKISDFVYDKASAFYNMYKYDGEKRLEEDYQLGAMVIKDGIYQIIDPSLNRYSLNKEPASDIVGVLKNGYGAIKKENGKYIAVDSEFRIISEEFEYIGQCSENLTVFTSGGKFGALDSSFNIYIDPIYNDFAVNSYDEAFNCSRFFAITSNSYNLFDYSGNIIGSDSYENAHAFYNNGKYAAVKNNGKWGFVDVDGNIVIDYAYEEAKSFSEGVAAVKKNGKWGYINIDNEVIIDYQFKDASPFSKYRTAAVLSEDGYKLIAFYWMEDKNDKS